MSPGRRSLTALAALVAVLTLLHLAVNGYSFGGSNGRPSSPSSDHANILPWVYWYSDPSLFPHDAAIQMNASYATILWRFAAWISRAVPVEATFFLLHLLSVAGAYAAILFLARACGGSGAGGLLACVFFLIERAGPAGVGTHDPALYTRTAALPLALWALGAILSGRPVLGGIVLGAAYAVHPLTAFYAAAIALPLWLLSGDLSKGRRLAGAAAFGAIALSASAALGGDAAGSLGRPSPAWLQLQTGNNAMHLFPWMWGEGVWRDFLLGAALVLPALLGDAPPKARRLAISAGAAAAGLALLGWTTTTWIPSMLFMQIQPFRGLGLTIVVGLVLGGVWIARRLGLEDARLETEREPAGESEGAGRKGPRKGAERSGRAAAEGRPARRSPAGPKLARDGHGVPPAGGALAGERLVLASGAIAILGLIAHANLIALAGIGLLATTESRPRLRLALAGASAVLLLAWGARDGAGLAARVAPEATRAFGTIGGAAWGLALVAAPPLLVLAGGARRRRVLGAGTLALAGAALALATFGRGSSGGLRYVPETDYPLVDRANPWVDVQRWVASHVPADAFVLNPPYLEGFRTYGRRSQFVDWKQGTLSMFNEPFGLEWLRRMQAIVQRPIDPANAWRNVVLNYESMPPAALETLVRRYGLTHMVTESAAKDRPLPWREVYANGVFRVLETGAPPPALAAGAGRAAVLEGQARAEDQARAASGSR